VDNLNLEGILDSSKISITDLRAGLFDYAEIRIFMVNYKNLSQGDLKMRRGRLGEVTLTEQGMFRAELRGLTQNLSQRIVEVYQPECRADLGDSRCKVPVDPDLIARDTDYELGDFVKVITDGGATGQAQYENRIYECTTAGPTGPTQPTFNTTVDATTTDSDIPATATLTLSSNAVNGNTVTIEGQVYTFTDPFVDSADNVAVGASASDSIDNLIAAINNGAGEGTLYGTGTTVNSDVTAAAGAGDTMDVEAITAGSAGNDISVSDNNSNMTWGVTSLEGGVDGAVFTARQAWTRHGVVDTVTDQVQFTLTVAFDESRAVDDWFSNGVIAFEDGDNAGRALEIRDWTQSTREVTLFLAAPFTVAPGTLVKLFPGCDKRDVTCSGKFVIAGSRDFDTGKGNIENFRGENAIPGQDELTRYPDAKSG
jgi:hypothetical protein